MNKSKNEKENIKIKRNKNNPAEQAWMEKGSCRTYRIQQEISKTKKNKRKEVYQGTMTNKANGELVRKTLDLLIDRANCMEDFITIKFALDDYMDEGYFVKVQIQKYNDKVIAYYDAIKKKN